MITVRLPAALHIGTTATLVISEPLGTIGDLITTLERRIPGFRDVLEDGLFGFAVNDVAVLHHARTHPLADGDRVEIVPSVAGGSASAPPRT